MFQLNARRVTIIAAVVAFVVYANAVRNGWAGDDVLVVRDNLRVHSIRAALAAWFLPYWPPPWQGAGLYRPLTILSYGIEWALGGGAAAVGGKLWVFHFTNIVLHAVATALVVRLALAWLPPLGALVAGIVFAVHPIHVEAVSNVVGRAELLAAVGLFAAVLAARHYRHALTESAAHWWLLVTLVIVALALLSKEHAAIAVAVIAVDHVVDPEPQRRRSVSLYLGVVVVTLAWLAVWRSIAGLYVAGGATTAFYGLSSGARLATMLPVQLEVLRLLAWPLDLSSDYSQQTEAIRTALTPVAVLGFVAMTAVVALGLLLIRRAPPVAFGILLAAGSYAPTSNLLFTSGVVLAERALYVAVLAPSLVLGWLVTRGHGKDYGRVLGVAVGLLVVVFGVKTWTRTPFWKTPQTTIIEDAGDHPENYRARLHLADLLASKHDSARALAEYLSAEELAGNDPFIILFVVNTAVALKRYDLAIEHARRAYQLAPDDSRPPRWLVQALLAAGRADSAIATAQASAMAHPRSWAHADTYVFALVESGASRGRRLLAAASADWLSGQLVQSTARLDSLVRFLGTASNAALPCADVDIARPTILALAPGMTVRCDVDHRVSPKPMAGNN